MGKLDIRRLAADIKTLNNPWGKLHFDQMGDVGETSGKRL